MQTGALAVRRTDERAPRRPQGPVIEHGAKLPPWWRYKPTANLAIGVIATVCLVLAGVGIWYFDRAPLARRLATVVGNTANPDPANMGVARADAAEGALWRQTEPHDPIALQKYLAMYPNGRYAHAAAGALRLLEGEAWAAIEQQSDAGARLAALSEFAIQFSAGDHAQDATRVRASTLQMVEKIERGLAANGYDPGVIDGVISTETVSAIQRYRRAMSLEANNVIDASLLAQLEATSPRAGSDVVGADEVSRAASSPATLTGAPTVSSASIGSPAKAASPSSARPSSTVGADDFRDCFVCPQMTSLPLGRARIGDPNGDPDERPVHEIAISYRVAVGKFEVTNDEWAACAREGGCARMPATDAGGMLPVAGVSWRDARQYVAWLSRKTGARYRLLSEAEWEYAARAGSQTAFASGDSDADLCAYANHADAGASYTWRNRACTDGFASGPAPVGSFKANAFGLHDMSGNVWEWVEDCWHPTYAGAPVNGAAWTTDCTGVDHVLRGGSWTVRSSNTRAAYRYTFAPDQRAPFFGLRVARAMD